MHRDSQYMNKCEEIAGEKLPKPKSPFLGIKGRKMAVGLPLFLGLLNVIFSVVLLYMFFLNGSLGRLS